MVCLFAGQGVLEVQEPGRTDFLADTYDDNVRKRMDPCCGVLGELESQGD